MLEWSLSQNNATQDIPITMVQPHLTLKERQRQERENLILQVAEEIFAEKGYQDTSMDELATRVGIAKSTVYLHFSCKEALIIAIVTRDMQHFLDGVDEVTASEQGARARLEALLHYAYTGLCTRQTQLFSVLFHDAKLQQMAEQKKHIIAEKWEKLASRVTAILEEGKRTGEIDASFPTDVLMVAFFSIFFSPISRHRAKKGALPQDFLQHMERLYFDGAVTKCKKTPNESGKD